MICLKEDINSEKVLKIHIDKAISMIKPIISKEMIEYYMKFSLKNEK